MAKVFWGHNINWKSNDHVIYLKCIFILVYGLVIKIVLFKYYFLLDTSMLLLNNRK